MSRSPRGSPRPMSLHSLTRAEKLALWQQQRRSSSLSKKSSQPRLVIKTVSATAQSKTGSSHVSRPPCAMAQRSSNTATTTTTTSATSSSSSNSSNNINSPASSIENVKQRLQKSAKKQKQSIRSGISSTTMRLKQRLSSAKKRKRPVSHALQQHSTKRRRGGRTAVSALLHRESGSVRAAKAIEDSLPERRLKERQQRLKIMALGDMQVAEEYLKFGQRDKAAETLDQMSPETIVVAKTTSVYWIQRVQVRYC